MNGKKVAVITGGSSGIGLAVAREMAKRGDEVTIVSKTRAKLERAKETLQAEGLAVEVGVADVCDPAAIDAVVRSTFEEHGRLDLIFNNAGVTVFGEARDHVDEDWVRVIDTNLNGVIHGVRSAYPIMIRQGFGHIVNMASLAGLVPTPGAVAYTASKCAVVGLSQALRIEAERYGVRVSVVCPAAVLTPIIDVAPYRCLDRERFLASVPGKPDTPAACARSILRGIERNDAVIAPGFAGLLWRLQRYLPFVARAMMGKMRGLVAESRASYEKSAIESRT